MRAVVQVRLCHLCLVLALVKHIHGEREGGEAPAEKTCPGDYRVRGGAGLHPVFTDLKSHGQGSHPAGGGSRGKIL